MGMWHCNIKCSWYLQFLSLLVHGILALIILLAPWSESLFFIWVLLLIVCVWSALGFQRRLYRMQGQIVLSDKKELKIYLGSDEWFVEKKPEYYLCLLVFNLVNIETKKTFKLVLAMDSVEAVDWRKLHTFIAILQFEKPTLPQ